MCYFNQNKCQSIKVEACFSFKHMYKTAIDVIAALQSQKDCFTCKVTSYCLIFTRYINTLRVNPLTAGVAYIRVFIFISTLSTTF